MRAPLYLLLASVCLLWQLADSAWAQPPRGGPGRSGCLARYNVSGPNAASIQPVVDVFRELIGFQDNGTGGSFISGRREVNWDDVPDAEAEPSSSPNIPFSYGSRGLRLHSSTRNGRFRVSADSSNATNTPPRFGNIHPSYASAFQTFSGERLLGVTDTTVVEVEFFVPNTQKPATVRAFGVVLADVDSDSATTAMVFTHDGYLIDTVPIEPVKPAPNGLSFLGIVSYCTREIGRVEIFVGNTPLGANNVEQSQNATDVVALDDFIFAEPHAINETATDFDGDGAPDIAIYRPSNGGWYVIYSGSNTVDRKYWGQPGDIPVPADYDGDGRVEVAVFRPSEARWFFLQSPPDFPRSEVFGLPGDIPLPFDYDRDGRADLAVWRPSDGGFYINFSSNGGTAIYWGKPGDIPLTRQ